MSNTRPTYVFIGLMTLAAVSTAGYAAFASHTPHMFLAVPVLALASASSRMKVKLPGINGNMSVNLPFLFSAIVNLSAAEAVLITCASTVLQCWPRKNTKVNRQQMTFNLSMMAFATAIASLLAHANWIPSSTTSLHGVLSLLLASAALFLGQTAPVAGIVALTEGRSAMNLWRDIAQLSFPYYVLSAGVTSMLQALGGHLGWGLALAVFPVMYAIHRSYRMYFNRMVESIHPPVLVRAAGAGR
jgi:hypothetical protein